MYKLKETDCIPKKSGVKSKPVVVNLIEVQTRLIGELEKMIALVAQKNVEIVTLKDANLKGQEEGPGRNKGLSVENKLLRAKVKPLEAKVEELNKQILKNHATENERINLLLRQLSNPSLVFLVDVCSTGSLSCSDLLSPVFLVLLSCLSLSPILFMFLCHGITCSCFYNALVLEII